jgi:DNA polymerase III epsilon subunit-like protein
MHCDTEWVLIDTETTGLFAPIHVIDLAAVKMRGWRPTGETFQMLLNHQVHIPSQVTAIHGYTREYLERHGSAPQLVYEKFARFAGQAPLCAHNLSFDLNRALIPEWERLRLKLIPNVGFCTVKLTRRVLPEVKFHGLDYLIERYGIKNQRAHHALTDTLATAQLMHQVVGKRLKNSPWDNFQAVQKLVSLDRRKAVRLLKEANIFREL